MMNRTLDSHPSVIRWVNYMHGPYSSTESICESLRRLVEDCSGPHWDGGDAQRLDPMCVVRAIQDIQEWSSGEDLLPGPCVVVVTPEGNLRLMFERRKFSVEYTPEHRILSFRPGVSITVREPAVLR